MFWARTIGCAFEAGKAKQEPDKFFLHEGAQHKPAIVNGGDQHVHGNDIGFGIGYKSYLKSSKVSPYFSPKAGVFINNPDKGKSLVDLYFGLGIGADYFFDPKFCIGVEAQLNGTKSDKMSARFGNPGGINLNTAAALNAIIYF